MQRRVAEQPGRIRTVHIAWWMPRDPYQKSS
jgi:hypothetical protein